MARLMCIATHHKGGTIWIRRVIKALSAESGIPWIGLWTENEAGRIPHTGHAFLVNWRGWFPDALWQSDDAAFLHLIRDPRDILISGASYHHRAGVAGEEFLHQPRDDLEGRTYQEHIIGLKTQDEKLLFEMENKHAETLGYMRAWPYDDPRTIELRYEDLMQDTETESFGQALADLGLANEWITAGRKFFWEHSLFGGLREALPNDRLQNHIESHGRLRRWQTELPYAVGQRYAERFGDDLIALGYETDNTWVDTLPEAPVGPAAATPAPTRH